VVIFYYERLTILSYPLSKIYPITSSLLQFQSSWMGLESHVILNLMVPFSVFHTMSELSSYPAAILSPEWGEY